MKKLEYWKDWFQAAQKKYGADDPDFNVEFRRLMKTTGFVRPASGLSKKVWVNEKKRIVIKRPYLVSPGNMIKNPKVLAVRIPTLFAEDKWVFQPLCDTSRRREAYDIVWRKLDEAAPYTFFDMHSDNVGHYRNKAVFFDW
jgi:hypothetical protein